MSDAGPIALSATQQRYADLIVKAWTDAGYDADIGAAAVVNAWAESRLNPAATSPSGKAVGLFQAHEDGLGHGYTVEQRQNAAFNIKLMLGEMRRVGAPLVAAQARGARVPELAGLFCYYLERPGGKDLEKRRAYAAARVQIARRFGFSEDAVAELGWSLTASLAEAADAMKAKAGALYDDVAGAPERFKAKAQEFATFLDQTRANLGRMAADYAKYAKGGGKFAPEFKASYNRLVGVYNLLAGPFYSEGTLQTGGAKPGTMPEIGVAPVVAVAVAAGVLALSAAAVAWAVVGWETAKWARDNTQLQADDLAARVKAMDEGKSLQNSTLPPPAPPSVLPDWLLPVTGLVVVVAGAAAAYPLFRRG